MNSPSRRIRTSVTALADDASITICVLDGIRAHLFAIDDLQHLPVIGDIIRDVDVMYPTIEQRRRVHEVIRRAISTMVGDVCNETKKRLEAEEIESADEVRKLGKPIVSFSVEMDQANAKLKAFLFENMYRHYKVNRMASKARRLVQQLFSFYFAEPDCLPTEWWQLASGRTETERAVVVADFIAGMTDRYAIDEYNRVFDMRVLG
ncbi:MAG: hypothetical protein U1E36_07550 [Rickettsiales bacterium]